MSTTAYAARGGPDSLPHDTAATASGALGRLAPQPAIPQPPAGPHLTGQRPVRHPRVPRRPPTRAAKPAAEVRPDRPGPD